MTEFLQLLWFDSTKTGKKSQDIQGTKDTDRDGINGQNTHTTHREWDNFRIVLISDNSSFIERKFWIPSLFGKISKTQTFPFYKGSFQLWLSHPHAQIPENYRQT